MFLFGLNISFVLLNTKNYGPQTLIALTKWTSRGRDHDNTRPLRGKKGKVENTFLYFMNEQRKLGWTDCTAKGHITIPHSQTHRSPDTWMFPFVINIVQASVMKLQITFQQPFGHMFQWDSWSLRVTYPSQSNPFGCSFSMWSQRFSRIPKRRFPFSCWAERGHWKPQKQHLSVWLRIFPASLVLSTSWS